MQVRSLGQEDPLEQGMATHSSILAWKIPMDREAWEAIIHRVAKSLSWLKWLSTHTCKPCLSKGDLQVGGSQGVALPGSSSWAGVEQLAKPFGSWPGTAIMACCLSLLSAFLTWWKGAQTGLRELFSWTECWRLVEISCHRVGKRSLCHTLAH